MNGGPTRIPRRKAPRLDSPLSSPPVGFRHSWLTSVRHFVPPPIPFALRVAHSLPTRPTPRARLATRRSLPRSPRSLTRPAAHSVHRTPGHFVPSPHPYRRGSTGGGSYGGGEGGLSPLTLTPGLRRASVGTGPSRSLRSLGHPHSVRPPVVSFRPSLRSVSSLAARVLRSLTRSVLGYALSLARFAHSPRFSLFTLIRSSFPFIPRSGAPAGRNDKGKR